jgi:hypothetical protein
MVNNVLKSKIQRFPWTVESHEALMLYLVKISEFSPILQQWGFVLTSFSAVYIFENGRIIPKFFKWDKSSSIFKDNEYTVI